MWITCGLWCFFNSNSDGTHSLQKIHLSASDVRLNFSHSVLMKKQTLLCLGWPKCKFQHIFMFRWIVPLTKIKKKWALQIYRNCNCFAGNFGDRYFGTDAPSDCYESDEGMDYWISSRPVCERLYLHTLEKETFKHFISYDCGPIALTYISINLCHLLLSILAILCATNEPMLNKGQSIDGPSNMGDYCSLAFLEMSSWPSQFENVSLILRGVTRLKRDEISRRGEKLSRRELWCQHDGAWGWN